jgi:hypothetical protein
VNNPVVNHGLDPALLLQLLQQQQSQHQAAMQQQQQTNELLQKQLAELAQQRGAERPNSRPLPDYKGDAFKGESGTVEAWIRSAQLQLLRLAENQRAGERAVDFLVTSFTGPAQVWCLHELQPRPATPDDLFVAVRTRFQPRLAAEDARRELRTLAQHRHTVAEYASRFRELLALLPATSFDETTRLEMFRDGLVDSVQSLVVQQAQQPATLEAMVELATRIESRTTGKKTGPSAAAAELETRFQQTVLAAISSLEQRVAAASVPPPRGGPQGGSRREGRPGRAAGRSNHPEWRSDDPLNAQSPEQRKKLMEKQLCFYCAQPGHRRPDCPVEARGAPPTPAALGN